jgi:hypothetical protein
MERVAMVQELETGIILDEEALELELVFPGGKPPAHPGRVPVPKQAPAPVCPRPTAQIVSGFARYSNAVASLPRPEQEKIRASARVMVGSFQPNCQPVVSVGLVGHADRDVQRGPVFAKRISTERAQAVRQALESSIADPNILGRIRWQVVGAGADLLLVPNPKTEVERARNRRVEIFLGPIPMDGLINGVTVDARGARIRFLVQGQPRGEYNLDLYRDQNGPPVPLLPRTEWMRRGALLGLAQRAFAASQRVKLIVANDLVDTLEIYKR